MPPNVLDPEKIIHSSEGLSSCRVTRFTLPHTLAAMTHSEEGFVFVNHDHLTFLKSTFLLAPRLATMTHSKEGFVILNLQTVTVEVFPL